MDLAIVKRHPYVTGVVALFAVIIIYLIMKRGSSSSSSAAVAPGGGDAVLATVNSAQSLADAQTNAQIDTATIQGQVATNQINAELAAQKDTNATALAIVNTQTAGAVQANEDTQNASVQVATVNAQAAKDIVDAQSNTTLGVANLFAGVENNQINTVADVAKSAMAKGYNATKVATIVSSVQGLGPQAIAANQPSQVANSPASILKALNPASIIGSLFG